LLYNINTNICYCFVKIYFIYLIMKWHEVNRATYVVIDTLGKQTKGENSHRTKHSSVKR